MLALRATMRCSATTATLARSTFSSVKLIQINNNTTTTTNIALHRSAGTFHLQPQPAIFNGCLLQKRRFASKSDDNVDTESMVRIYYGSLTPRMRAVKVFSLTTSLAGLAAQPMLMEQGMKLGGTGLAVFLCGFGGFFTFVTPVLLHFVTKKYVTEIHYNPKTEEYVATTVSIILKKIQTKFRPSDVKVPAVPGMFTSFMVGDKPLFVDPALFDDPDHYVRIMGYDKPIDFKLGSKEKPSDAASTKDSTKSE